MVKGYLSMVTRNGRVTIPAKLRRAPSLRAIPFHAVVGWVRVDRGRRGPAAPIHHVKVYLFRHRLPGSTYP